MPHIFDNTADKAFHMIAIRKSTNEYPEQNELNELDSIIANLYGFALRTGGGLEKSSNQYGVGYLLPKGVTINLNQQKIIKEIENCSYFDNQTPFVTLTPVTVSKKELKRAELIGTPPQEALSGLKSFADDFNEQI